MSDLLYRVKWWVQDLRFADVVVIVVMGGLEILWVYGIVASLRGL